MSATISDPGLGVLDLFPNMTSAIGTDLTAASNATGIPLTFLATQAEQESSLNPLAVNGPAQGIGQIIPSTQSELGITNPFDAGQSIMGMAQYDAALEATGATFPQILGSYGTGANEFDMQAATLGMPLSSSYVNPLQFASIGAYSGSPYAPNPSLQQQMPGAANQPSIDQSILQGVQGLTAQQQQQQQQTIWQEIAAFFGYAEWPFKNPLSFFTIIIVGLLVVGVAWKALDGNSGLRKLSEAIAKRS